VIFMHVRPAPAPSPSRMFGWAVTTLALCFACFRTPPEISSALTAAIADWASIILAALPYVVIGAFAASLSRRLIDRDPHRSHGAVALMAILNPGCDCALNGFARALVRAQPALAGFALTFAAAASPASLAVTYTAFGMRMTLARAAGALVAAALTATAWHFVRASVGSTNVGPTFMVGQDHHPRKHDETRDLAAALGGVAFAAATAIAAKTLAPAAAIAHLTPAGAALFGALLSPCSTADPLLAGTLLQETRAQLSFMLAAQCLDVRQLLLVFRHFGAARAGATAACAAIACVIATFFV
jgi:uncharacterized membrane protein YraQ (UPF0718 family)